ncbi:MAG TPA: SpoIIE family protein phosphatase [Motiliproteus sp.]
MPPPSAPNADPVFAQSIFACRILIIDDDPTSQFLLEEILQAQGFTQLYFADDGLQGLEMLPQIKPDLVLLDLVMPHLDGHEFCRRVRQMPEYKALPVLVQTGQGDTQSRIDAFAAGASDFVTKPLLGEEIIARISMHLDKQILISQLSAYQRRVSVELESARRMQLELLPRDNELSALETRYGVDIAHCYRASSELGGDYYGFIPLDKQRFAFYLGDFAGHGVGAAVNTFRTQILIQQVQRSASEPTQFLQALNAKLYNYLTQGQFSTMLYAVCDVANWTLRYATAAAPKPLLIEQGAPQVLPSSGTPLGINPNLFEVDEFEMELPLEGALLFHSDALIEEKGQDGSFYGRQRLVDQLAQMPTTMAADARLAQIVAGLDQHLGSRPLSDDLTAICLQLKRVSCAAG